MALALAESTIAAASAQRFASSMLKNERAASVGDAATVCPCTRAARMRMVNATAEISLRDRIGYSTVVSRTGVVEWTTISLRPLTRHSSARQIRGLTFTDRAEGSDSR